MALEQVANAVGAAISQLPLVDKSKTTQDESMSMSDRNGKNKAVLPGADSNSAEV